MAFMFFLYMKIFLFQLGELLAFLQGRYTGDELPQRLFGKVFISRSYLKDNFARWVWLATFTFQHFEYVISPSPDL